jgi:Ca2+-binding RTX toxin-like protein
VQYHSAPVTVTLDDVANDGRTSPVAENDNVQSDIEHVIGTEGDDRLTGGAGNETLDGGAGDDNLDGLAGADRLNGEDGDDVIRARDPLPTAFPDVVTCGAGADIIIVDLQDQFSADCEDVAQAAIDQGPGLQISHRALRQDRRGRVALRRETDPKGRPKLTIATLRVRT